MRKIGRNDLCPCGSGKKYKKCCMANDKKLSEEKKLAYLELESIHLPKDPDFCESGEFKTIEEIIKAYEKLGYVVDIEHRKYENGEILSDAEFLEVNLICPHGFSEYCMGYEMKDDMWTVGERGEGEICSVCEFIREHKAIPSCHKCGTIISILPTELRLEYYKKGIHYFEEMLCPNCYSDTKKQVQNQMENGENDSDDLQNPDFNDPFRPDLNSEKIVKCLHCGDEYKEKEIKWSKTVDMWVCKNYPRCDGAGLKFDIHHKDD